jgi:hypothetical protein
MVVVRVEPPRPGPRARTSLRWVPEATVRNEQGDIAQ